MSNPLTPQEEVAVREREAKATPGPWIIWRGHLSVHAGPILENTPSFIRGGKGGVCEYDDLDFGKTQAKKNAEFGAHARTDIPALLATLDYQRKVIEQMQELAQFEVDIDGDVVLGDGEKYRDKDCVVELAAYLRGREGEKDV